MDMQEYFISLIFQPTPSSRRATAPPLGERHQHLRISTHALLAEGDVIPDAIDSMMDRISTHALLAEGDAMVPVFKAPALLTFQPTPSSRRATCILTRTCGDHQLKFQPTPSSRRATQRLHIDHLRDLHFNPRPPRGGRHHRHRGADPRHLISTHALLAEGDGRLVACGRIYLCISTHALLAEGDNHQSLCKYHHDQFQPTPSSRRATALLGVKFPEPFNFNPRPPRGGRPVSLHNIQQHLFLFQPTPSSRRAT